MGQISDYPGRSRPVYTDFARCAAQVVDLLVFVGDRPEGLWGGSRRVSPDFLTEFRGLTARVEIFSTVRDASRFLRGELRSGDLLLLKGSGPSDHLERIVLAHQTDVECWRAHCGLVVGCDSCQLLHLPAQPDDVLKAEL
jgi:UDP-N-acetylmuramyl pentapeptide synthase